MPNKKKSHEKKSHEKKSKSILTSTQKNSIKNFNPLDLLDFGKIPIEKLEKTTTISAEYIKRVNAEINRRHPSKKLRNPKTETTLSEIHKYREERDRALKFDLSNSDSPIGSQKRSKLKIRTETTAPLPKPFLNKQKSISR